MSDLLFKGGSVIDGLGTPMYPADVGMREAKIDAIGTLEGTEAARTIDKRSPDADPERLESFYPAGILCVVVNGQVAMKGQHYAGTRAGRVLRK